jgi:type IV pilus assembly protein PilF
LLTHKFISRILALLAVGFLSSCITTTTGGFLVDTSDERATEDYVQLALAYFDADDMAGARRHVNNALDINARSSEAHMVLALIFQREGDVDLADENFRRSISLDRDNSRARNNYAALLFEQQRYRDAFEQLRRVANDTEYEGRAIAFENLGRAALRLNRESEAQNAFARALQLNSNLYVSAVELSLIYLEQQDFPRARSSYQSYLTIVEFYNVPHTPRALLAGIQIEGYYQNQKLVDDFALILSTLYQSSPEYQIYQRLSNAL